MADELICDCMKRWTSGFTLDVSLRIPLDRAPVTVLFGPSGSGKTTLLRVIAGLEKPDRATITFRGRAWDHLSPQQRRAGFLFQDYALFPHLTVARNVGFAAPPDRQKSRQAECLPHQDSKPSIRSGGAGATACDSGTVDRLMEQFGIADLANRLPRALSGGQQQRVALARAIAAGPDLLLLDEPLSALDAPTRIRLRHSLRTLLLSAGVPAIVVTHDRMEAVALGDWMAVIIDGRIHQTGPVQEVFRRPADRDVADSVGVENVLAAVIVGRDAGLITVQLGGAMLQCVDTGETGPVFVCIRAEDIAISRETATSTVRNRIPGRVRAVTPEGPLARVELDCGFPLVALVTAQSATDLHLAAGDAVSAIIKTTSVHLTAHA